MQTPLRITCRELQPTAALEARIREHLIRLERFHSLLLGCHVILEASTHAHEGGPAVDITIYLEVSDGELSVHRQPSESQDDIYIVLRNAFDTAKRVLKDHTRVCECRAQRERTGDILATQIDALGVASN
jgi:ribosome-associated translation inhibitor RaiA